MKQWCVMFCCLEITRVCPLSVRMVMWKLLGSRESRPAAGHTGRLLLLGSVLHESSDLFGLVLLSRCCTSCPPTPSGALTSSGARGTLLCCLQPPSMGASVSTPSWAAAPMAWGRSKLTRCWKLFRIGTKRGVGNKIWEVFSGCLQPCLPGVPLQHTNKCLVY